MRPDKTLLKGCRARVSQLQTCNARAHSHALATKKKLPDWTGSTTKIGAGAAESEREKTHLNRH
jgi:hypothetical protein